MALEARALEIDDMLPFQALCSSPHSVRFVRDSAMLALILQLRATKGEVHRG